MESADHPIIKRAFDWLEQKNGENFLNPDEHCPTRDVFDARYNRLVGELEARGSWPKTYSLIAAIAGELANNSFDHNLGMWRDEKGIYFRYDLSKKVIVIADRGQGVLATLKHVKNELQTEDEAIKVAFTEFISGRAPEKRGNGLKFVAEQVQKNGFTLRFYSNGSMYSVRSGLEKGQGKELRGVLAILLI